MSKLFLTVLFSFCSLLMLNSCDEQKCETKACNASSTNSNRAINLYDIKPGSPYYNQSVANFRFIQTSTKYTQPNECTVCDVGSFSVTLQIANNTNKTIYFDYNITFVLNFASWSYQNVCTIPPYGTTDIGQISSNGASITLGSFAIQSANISYQ